MLSITHAACLFVIARAPISSQDVRRNTSGGATTMTLSSRTYYYMLLVCRHLQSNRLTIHLPQFAIKLSYTSHSSCFSPFAFLCPLIILNSEFTYFIHGR
jgi:hypothetical protein